MKYLSFPSLGRQGPFSLGRNDIDDFVYVNFKDFFGYIKSSSRRKISMNTITIQALRMSRNKSFDVRARFGAIYSASKTKKYLLKNSTIGNRLLFSELANTEFTCPEN